jgi:RNA polymerase sigma-70 factor (ECF subfamily)
MTEQNLPAMNEELLRRYMNDYGTSLLKLTYSYVKNWSTAEDLVQETFITVYNKYHLFDQRSQVKTWIYQIAINKSKDYLRSPKSRLLEFSVTKFMLRSKDNSPDEEVIEEEESARIVATLMKVPTKYREVLNLYYYESMSVKEISYLLSITEANVKTRLNRGRDKFKKLYEREVQRNERNIREIKDILG